MHLFEANECIDVNLKSDRYSDRPHMCHKYMTYNMQYCTLFDCYYSSANIVPTVWLHLLCWPAQEVEELGLKCYQNFFSDCLSQEFSCVEKMLRKVQIECCDETEPSRVHIRAVTLDSPIHCEAPKPKNPVLCSVYVSERDVECNAIKCNAIPIF